MSTKEKCTSWEKCYRKDKKHLTSYVHPIDVKDEESKAEDKEDVSTPKSSLRKEKTVELLSEPPATKTSTSPLRKRKTHEISVDNEAAEFFDEPPEKKVKAEEPIATLETKEDNESDAQPETKPSSVQNRTKCKYGKKCYRKDKGHKGLYIHPGDPDEQLTNKDKASNANKRQTRTSTRPVPLHRLDSVDKVLYGGFILKRTGSNYECTCSSYTGADNFGKPNNQKTCTHLIGYLGEDFERARCQLPEKGKKERIPQYINVSVLLAHKYKEGEINPKGWWLSEKLDGVRAYWNGNCFYSRLGNAFNAPSWFTKDLPRDMHLDGELFGGRKQFQSTVSIVKTPDHEQWKKISYNVFDAPHLENEPFEKRMEAIKKYFDQAKPKYAKLVAHEKCTGAAQIEQELKRIIALGGEGLMIRKPGSKYERTRSRTLLKIKKFHDAEARVIGYEASKSNSGLTGALWVQMANGKKFKVGSGLSNKDRRCPPMKGTIITYKFQEYSNSGTPRFPSYIGIRIDMTEPKDAEGVVTEATDD